MSGCCAAAAARRLPRPARWGWLRPTPQLLHRRLGAASPVLQRRWLSAGSDVDDDRGQPRLTRAERRRLRRQKKGGAAPGGGGVSPAVSQSSARDAAIRLWEKEPTLFESSRSGLCRTLSALAVLQSSGWTWFAATSYGPMAAPLAEGGWQMSYWLTSTVLTISYGFLAGAYLYSTRYVCRLRISDRAPPPPPPLPPASAAGLTAHRRRPQPPRWR